VRNESVKFAKTAFCRWRMSKILLWSNAGFIPTGGWKWRY